MSIYPLILLFFDTTQTDSLVYGQGKDDSPSLGIYSRSLGNGLHNRRLFLSLDNVEDYFLLRLYCNSEEFLRLLTTKSERVDKRSASCARLNRSVLDLCRIALGYYRYY